MQTALIPVTQNGSVALPTDDRYVLPGGYNADPSVFAAGEAEAAHMPPGSDPRNALIARLYATIERVEDELTQVYAELERAWAALEEARGTSADTLTTVEANAPQAENRDTAPEPAPSPLAAESSEAAECDTAPADELPHSDDDAPQPIDESQPLPSHENDSTSNAVDQSPRDGVKISARQRRAALLLAGGSKTIHVARSVGVSRNTVQTWKRDAGFQALLNSHTIELQESAQARLLASANSAVGVLVNKVLAGDTKISLQLLKGLGFLTGKPQERGCERADQLECNEM